MRYSNFHIGLLVGLLALLALSLILILTVKKPAESPMIAGWIEQFNPPVKIQRRDSSPEEEAKLLTPVYQGDKVTVPTAAAWVCLQLGELKLVEVKHQNSPYEVKQQGTVPSRLGNFWKPFGELLMPLFQVDQKYNSNNTKPGDSHCEKPLHLLRSTTPVNIKSNGSADPVTISWPNSQEQPPYLFAGKRPLYLTWWGGQSPYTITVTGVDNSVLLPSPLKTEQPPIKISEVEFKPGEYQAIIKDNANNETPFRFTVVTQPATVNYPPEAKATELPATVRKTLQATWLATQENGKWSFEAYQQVADIAENYYPAWLLSKKLEVGKLVDGTNK